MDVQSAEIGDRRRTSFKHTLFGIVWQRQTCGQPPQGRMHGGQEVQMGGGKNYIGSIIVNSGDLHMY